MNLNPCLFAHGSSSHSHAVQVQCYLWQQNNELCKWQFPFLRCKKQNKTGPRPACAVSTLSAKKNEGLWACFGLRFVWGILGLICLFWFLHIGGSQVFSSKCFFPKMLNDIRGILQCGWKFYSHSLYI